MDARVRVRAGAFITHLLHAKPVGVSVGEHAGARATARGACREPARAGAEVLVVSWSWWSRLPPPCGPVSSLREGGVCSVFCMHVFSFDFLDVSNMFRLGWRHRSVAGLRFYSRTRMAIAAAGWLLRTVVWCFTCACALGDADGVDSERHTNNKCAFSRESHAAVAHTRHVPPIPCRGPRARCGGTLQRPRPRRRWGAKSLRRRSIGCS